MRASVAPHASQLRQPQVIPKLGERAGEVVTQVDLIDERCCGDR